MMTTVAAKELRHALDSQVATIVVLVFVIAPALPVFWMNGAGNVFLTGQADLTNFFGTLPFLLAVLVPALAMRAWAEERARGTDELLASMPLSSGDLVLGKFLALLTITALCLLGTVSLPILVAGLGDLDRGPVIGGYLGALLLAATALSIALFVGTLVRNQVTAFVLSLLALAVGVFVQVRALNLHERFVNIARGVIDSRDLGFYLGLTALFLFAAIIRLEFGRTGRTGALLKRLPVLSAILVLTVISQFVHQRADLTRDRLYSLNQGSLDVLEALDEPIRMTLYFSEKMPPRFAPVADFVRTLAAQYEEHGGGMLRLEIHDPDSDPEIAEEARGRGVEKTLANITSEGRVEAVELWFGIALRKGAREEVFPSVGAITNLEYDLTSAVLRLHSDRQPRLVLLGPTLDEHGGTSFDIRNDLKPISRELEKLHEVTQIRVAPETEIDLSKADAVFAWGLPYYSEEQLRALDRYLVGGGQLMLLVSGMRIDPNILVAQPLLTSRADAFYEHLGFRVRRTLVSDTRCTKIRYTKVRPPVLESYPPFPLLTKEDGSLAPKHSATTYLDTLVLPWSSNLEILTSEGITARIIAQTSDQAWLQEENWEIDPGKVPGPTSFDRYTLGLAVSGRFRSFFDPEQRAEYPTTLLVWGSEHVLTQANQQSILQWAVHQAGFLSHRGQMTDIDRRENAFSPIRETDYGEKKRIRWLSVTVVPTILLLLAVVRVFWRRRHNRKLLADIAG